MIAIIRRSVSMHWGIAAAALVFSALCGLLTAIGFGLPVVVLVSVLAGGAALLAHFGLSSYKVGGNGPFWSALILSVALSVLSIAAPLNVSGVMEVWLIALTPLIVWSMPASLRSSWLLRLLSLLFLSAMVIMLVSTAVAPHTQLKAALYQLAYNIKWPLMLLLGFRVCWQSQDHRRLNKLIWLYGAVVCVFIALDVAAPSVYKLINRNFTEYHHTSNPLLGGYYWRLTGPFIHSSVLAYYSAMFMVLVAVQRAGRLIGNVQAVLLMSVMTGFMVLSGQMQETTAAFAIVFVVFAAFRVKSMLGMVAIVGVLLLLVAAAFTMIVGMDRVMALASEWGMTKSVSAVTSARPVFYSDSFRLASENFPLGTGLGTYAGIGAMKFNRELYESMGYVSYWWYQLDVFLMDTYWPNFIAEGGWIAAFLLLMIPALIVMHSLSRLISSAERDVKVVWAYAFAAQAVVLVTSLTSPIFADPNMSAFVMMMFGMAHVYEQRQKRTAEPRNAFVGLRKGRYAKV